MTEERVGCRPLDLVLAAHTWPTNAHLIADVAKLGYLDGAVCDPTYGLGKWWTIWRPRHLVAHDIDPAKSPAGASIDFRDTPHGDGVFDAVAFDPPYMPPGGRSTSTIDSFNDRYGLHTTPTTPSANQESINAGVDEAHRILRDGGILAVKCMDFISSGSFWPGTHLTTEHAVCAGFALVDRFEHVRRPGPQPPYRQIHARRNLSTLLVFRRDRRPTKPRLL